MPPTCTGLVTHNDFFFGGGYKKEKLCSCLDGQSKTKKRCHLTEWDLSYKTTEYEVKLLVCL